MMPKIYLDSQEHREIIDITSQVKIDFLGKYCQITA
jgi:hypothetical protein